MSRGPSPVGLYAPDMLGLFDALQKGARKLMDSAQLDQNLFDGRYEERAKVLPLAPVNDARGTAIAGVVSIPLDQGSVNVIILTSSVEPQHWRIDLDGFVVARKDLADRAEWAKKPDTEGKQPPDGAWNFTGLANDQIVHNPVALKIVKDVLNRTLREITQIAEEVSAPDYVERATKARNARLGLAVVEDASNQIDVSQLMGRIARGANRP